MLNVCHQARANTASGRADEGSRLHSALQGKDADCGLTRFPEKPPCPRGGDILLRIFAYTVHAHCPAFSFMSLPLSPWAKRDLIVGMQFDVTAVSPPWSRMRRQPDITLTFEGAHIGRLVSPLYA